jgi:hypothetical protein
LATKRTPQNGRDRLEEAMTTLMQNQTMLMQNQAAFLARLSENDRRLAEAQRLSADRFARLEAEMAAVRRVLAELSLLLERLPEAVRDKIGFKPSP